MLKRECEAIKESGVMFILTMILTKFLLAAVAAVALWLVELLLTDNIRLTELTREFRQF